jgi:tripartite ATP-independent transporter DctM subunit
MDVTLILFIAMLAALGVALMRGYPVAFTLAGVALLFGLLGIVIANVTGIPIGTLNFGTLSLFTERTYGIMTNEVLLAVPLFVAMGVMLEKSKVAEDLLETMGELFGSLRGGLGISITVVGALLAASTGIVGATVVTMGLISLPTMLKRGYDPALASGSIAAAGTLGQIIPPSIVLVLLGDVLSASYQQAQRDMGIFSPDTVTVGDLFAGAFLPGLGLVVLYILYQAGVAIFRPEASPAMPRDKDHKIDGRFFVKLLQALVVPIALIVAVLGSILTGIATPTEAAAVGAVGAILLGGLKMAPDKWKRITFAAIGLVLLLLQGAFKWFPDESSWLFLAMFLWGFVESLLSALKKTPRWFLPFCWRPPCFRWCSVLMGAKTILSTF